MTLQQISLDLWFNSSVHVPSKESYFHLVFFWSPEIFSTAQSIYGRPLHYQSTADQLTIFIGYKYNQEVDPQRDGGIKSMEAECPRQVIIEKQCCGLHPTSGSMLAHYDGDDDNKCE